MGHCTGCSVLFPKLPKDTTCGPCKQEKADLVAANKPLPRTCCVDCGGLYPFLRAQICCECKADVENENDSIDDDEDEDDPSERACCFNS